MSYWPSGNSGKVLVSNGGTGYSTWAVLPQTGSYTVGTGLGIGTTQPMTNAFTFNTAENKPVLVITKDGDVEWHGKPSEAAKVLITSFQFAVENEKGITKAARRRYYLKACQNILNKAEAMEHTEFVDFLRKQVYNKERTVIMDSLKGNE